MLLADFPNAVKRQRHPQLLLQLLPALPFAGIGHSRPDSGDTWSNPRPALPLERLLQPWL